MKMLPIPHPDQLRTLELVEKPRTVGFVAFFFIGFIRFWSWVGIEAARQAYEDYKQECEGRIYWKNRYPSESLQHHESVHDWQRRMFGRLYYWTAYGNVLDRTRCAHLEAMACGYQVAFDGRQAEERARTLKNGPYFFGKRWPVERLTSLIEGYADKFRRETSG